MYIYKPELSRSNRGTNGKHKYNDIHVFLHLKREQIVIT